MKKIIFIAFAILMASCEQNIPVLSYTLEVAYPDGKTEQMKFTDIYYDRIYMEKGCVMLSSFQRNYKQNERCGVRSFRIIK